MKIVKTLPLTGVFEIDPSDPSRVSILIDGTHRLCIHRTDEGVVLDTWSTHPDAESSVFSVYFFDDELIGEELVD